MRRFLIVCWLLVPVAAGAYHYGPGQDHMVLDEAAAKLEEAAELAVEARQTSESDGDEAARSAWEKAAVAFEDALKILPADQIAEGRRARLELCKANMMISKLPEANADLEQLVDELVADSDAAPQLLADARHALANSQYYMTWLMRLEGRGRVDWEPEIEGARQVFKLLAEEAAAAGDAKRAENCREDLESAVRLARMDLSELQGLPLPSQ